MMDNADPLAGWDFAEVLETSVGNAAFDICGKLIVHVRSLLLSFKHRLSTTGVIMELHNLNATELPRTLSATTFARIEVCSPPLH